jgi:hypothetical protein
MKTAVTTEDPTQTLPGGDEMAVIHDPQGIPLALVRPIS